MLCPVPGVSSYSVIITYNLIAILTVAATVCFPLHVENQPVLRSIFLGSWLEPARFAILLSVAATVCFPLHVENQPVLRSSFRTSPLCDPSFLDQFRISPLCDPALLDHFKTTPLCDPSFLDYVQNQPVLRSSFLGSSPLCDPAFLDPAFLDCMITPKQIHYFWAIIKSLLIFTKLSFSSVKHKILAVLFIYYPKKKFINRKCENC